MLAVAALHPLLLVDEGVRRIKVYYTLALFSNSLVAIFTELSMRLEIGSIVWDLHIQSNSYSDAVSGLSSQLKTLRRPVQFASFEIEAWRIKDPCPLLCDVYQIHRK